MKRECGAALVLCLVVMMCLSGVGLAMIAAGTAEREISANTRGATVVALAAGAAIEGVLTEIGTAPDWSPLLAGVVKSRFGGGPHQVTTPSRAALDLDRVTTDLRADAAAAFPLGPDTPRWQLFAWGTLAGLAGLAAADSGAYVAVWVADDPADADGHDTVDANGVLLIHSEAFGFGATRASADVVLQRAGEGPRVLSWRSR